MLDNTETSISGVSKLRKIERIYKQFCIVKLKLASFALIMRFRKKV